jgi:streptogramin lyase
MNARATRALRPLLLSTAVVLAHCGGGGHATVPALPSSSTPTGGSAGTTSAGRTTASVVIDIPPKHTATTASGKRSTAYVSPSIESIVIAAAGGGTTTANLTPGSQNCVSQTPVITEYAVPDGGQVGDPTNITAGPDGNMWFTDGETGGNHGGWMYKVTPAGAFTQVAALNYQYNVAGIVSGPDGALWTVDNHSAVFSVGYVARVSTSGVVTYFSPPSLPQSTGVATTGGLVYFGVSASPDQIGTIDGNGNVTMVNNPTAYDFKPHATGPDGLIWGIAYPNTGPSAMSKLVGSSPVVYDVGYEPQDVAPGADGNMWFTATETDDGINQPVVGKISTSGTGLATYRVPAGMAQGSLAAGPDGNMWFAETQAKNIARVTPNGTITEYGLQNYPVFVAAGPDGNVWFTEDGGNFGYVGKITPPGTECTLTVNVPLGAPTGGAASNVTATSYDGLNGTGNALGIATVPFTATAAGPNVINFTLSGVVANVHVVAPASAALVNGTPTQIPLTVVALDAQGNTIIAPGGYADANGDALTITVTDSDATQTSILNPVVSAPGQGTSPTLTYTGTGAVTATLSATITGGTITGSVTGTTLTAH